jgi:hypothetical protein
MSSPVTMITINFEEVVE